MRAHLLALSSAVVLLGCNSGGGGSDAGGNDCPALTGKGTEHSGATTLKSAETWAAADGPHLVTGDLRIDTGGTLTWEPCAEVRMRGSRVVIVQGTGKLVAEGTPRRPISVAPEDGGVAWGFMQIFGPATARLAYTTLEGGGGEPANSFGALEARGAPRLTRLHSN